MTLSIRLSVSFAPNPGQRFFLVESGGSRGSSRLAGATKSLDWADQPPCALVLTKVRLDNPKPFDQQRAVTGPELHSFDMGGWNPRATADAERGPHNPLGAGRLTIIDCSIAAVGSQHGAAQLEGCVIDITTAPCDDLFR
jgi:hypothetical protein